MKTSHDKTIQVGNFIFLSSTPIENMSDEFKSELNQHRLALARLVKYVGVPFETIMRMSAELRAELYENSHALVKLVDDAGVPFETIMRMTDEIRSEFYRNSHAFARLAKDVSASPFERPAGMSLEAFNTMLAVKNKVVAASPVQRTIEENSALKKNSLFPSQFDTFDNEHTGLQKSSSTGFGGF